MLIGVPVSITPELLFALARMGHGDYIVIADANFPSDSVAARCVVNTPLRIHGKTSDVLRDILKIMPLDTYAEHPVRVMDRVQSDKDRGFQVVAYDNIGNVVGKEADQLDYVERMQFYEVAKAAFAIIQTDDMLPYANVIVTKGVLFTNP